MGWTTHKIIAHDAISNVNVSADYPDLNRFHDAIRDGAGFEAHDLPDNNHTQWWGNGVGPAPTNWFSAGQTPDGQEGAISLYKKYQFNEAYTRIGYELHCSQDEFVPAHIRYCQHGTWVYGTIRLDDLEYYAQGRHGYSSTVVPWSHLFIHSKGTNTFQYWLDDSIDDDDRDESGSDADDEGPPTTTLIKDITVTGWGIAETDWGTYGQPNYHYIPFLGDVLVEYLPGRDEGLDQYGKYLPGSVGIIHRQLKLSLDDSCSRLTYDATHLPPLIPDDATHGHPAISAKIFGPNFPVDISFVAMENRKKTVFVTILAGTYAIKDTGGKNWDGSSASTNDLAADSSVASLPWRDTIKRSWKGDLVTGELEDGSHTVKMKVRDQDGNDSEERTRSVKYDKTKPTGTITVNVLP
jgi:hypothetical protein